MIGNVVEKYEVIQKIGEGGMATVFRGYDLTLGREVAIKILDRELADDNSFRTRFRLEAQAASRMSHPAIVRVYDAGEDTDEKQQQITDELTLLFLILVHVWLLPLLMNAAGTTLISTRPLPSTRKPCPHILRWKKGRDGQSRRRNIAQNALLNGLNYEIESPLALDMTYCSTGDAADPNQHRTGR